MLIVVVSCHNLNEKHRRKTRWYVCFFFVRACVCLSHIASKTRESTFYRDAFLFSIHSRLSTWSSLYIYIGFTIERKENRRERRYTRPFLLVVVSVSRLEESFFFSVNELDWQITWWERNMMCAFPIELLSCSSFATLRIIMPIVSDWLVTGESEIPRGYWISIIFYFDAVVLVL